VEEGSDGYIFPGFKNKCPKSILGRTQGEFTKAGKGQKDLKI